MQKQFQDTSLPGTSCKEQRIPLSNKKKTTTMRSAKKKKRKKEEVKDNILDLLELRQARHKGVGCESKDSVQIAGDRREREREKERWKRWLDWKQKGGGRVSVESYDAKQQSTNKQTNTNKHKKQRHNKNNTNLLSPFFFFCAFCGFN
jgi:hypothetical protein